VELSHFLDIVAHEYTHAVVQTFAGNGGSLQLGNSEAKALNEAFADIFGTAVEFTVFSSGNLFGRSPNWTIGEDSWIPTSYSPSHPLRDLSRPVLTTYNTSGWTPIRIFIIGAVFELRFYIMAQPPENVTTGVNGKQVPYSVSGIGIDKAERIAYWALTHINTMADYSLDDFSFPNVRAYFIAGAKALFPDVNGVPSEEYITTKDAMIAVGLDDGIRIVVKNNFSGGSIIISSVNNGSQLRYLLMDIPFTRRSEMR